LSTATAPRPLGPATRRATSDAVDVLAVIGDSLADLDRRFGSVDARVRHGAAEADIVANNVHSVGIFEHFFDIDLPNAEPPVNVAPVVSLSVIAHASASCGMEEKASGIP
jgi:hypothetical protein